MASEALLLEARKRMCTRRSAVNRVIDRILKLGLSSSAAGVTIRRRGGSLPETR